VTDRAERDASGENAHARPGGENPDTSDAAAVLAHELRGPLTVVSGYLDLLGRAKDPQAREYALGAAHRAVRRMDALIDDVLESFDGAAATPRPLQAVDLGCLLESLIADVPAYRSRVVLHAAFVCRAQADELRLTRAVSNVLDNALKFSPAGTRVRVTLREEGERVAVVVEDEGPGIPPRDADRLRGRFERLARDDAVPGAGIGLGVTVDLIEGMGGTVQIGNRAHQVGARIELRLPAASKELR